MSIEVGRFGRNLLAGSAAVACAAVLAGPTSGRAEQIPTECKAYATKEGLRSGKFGLCSSYVENILGFQVADVEFGALSSMYALGNSVNTAKRDLARHIFRNRYWLEPRKKVMNRLNNWRERYGPEEYDVENRVVIKGLTLNRSADRAIVTSTQTWRVGDIDKTVYRERGQMHTATLCNFELPGIQHIQKEWTLVADKALPGFNCKRFGEQVRAGKIK